MGFMQRDLVQQQGAGKAIETRQPSRTRWVHAD